MHGFLHAAKTLNFTPLKCIVIEDCTSGIMEGLYFINVVKEKLLAAKADYYCHSVLELKRLIADLSKI